MSTNNGFRVLAGVCAGAVLAVSGLAHADEGAVKYRQSVMKAVAGHTGSIAQIAKGNVPFESHLAGHAHALAELSKLVPAAFEKRATEGKTRAKDDIWEDWDGFKAKAEDFTRAATAVADAAKSGGRAAAGPKLKALFDSCKGCHKEYRKKK